MTRLGALAGGARRPARERSTERFDPVLRLGGPRRGSRDPLDLASNDYLGLSRDERCRGGRRTRRWTATAPRRRRSRLVTGTLPVHRELEAARCAAHRPAERARLLDGVCRQPRRADRAQRARAPRSSSTRTRTPPCTTPPGCPGSRTPTFAHYDPAALDRELRSAARSAGPRRRRVDLLRPRRRRAPARASPRSATGTAPCSSSTRRTASGWPVTAAASSTSSASSGPATSS